MAETAFAPLVDDTNLETMFGPKYEPSNAQAARERIKSLDAGNSSTLTKVLAIGAALKGDARPLLQIEENKRKTALGVGILPELARIKEAQSQQKWEEAQALTEQLGLTVGAQAEHLVPLFQGLIEKNAKAMEKQRQREGNVNFYAAQPVGMNKDHPAYPIFQSYKKAVKDRSPLSDAIENNLHAAMKLHVQNINNQQILTSETTGQTAINTLPQVMSEKDINAYSGNEISGHYGISKAQIADVLNNASNDVEMKGQKIPLGHPLREQLKRDYYGLQPREAQLQIAPLVPIEPVLSTQFQAQGVAPLDIATRQGLTGAPSQAALQGQLGRKIQEVTAPALTMIYDDPTKAASVGVTFVDPKTYQKVPLKSLREAMRTPGAAVPVRVEDEQKIMEPVANAKAGLQYLPEMFKAYGLVDTKFSALGARVQREIGQRLGIPLAPNMTLGKAAELMVNRAIEQMESTQLIDSREVAQLKQLMLGRFADPRQAVEAANLVMQRLDEKMSRVVGQENVQPTPIDPARVTPGTPQSQAPGKLPVQTPVAPVQNLKDKAYLKKLKVGD